MKNHPSLPIIVSKNGVVYKDGEPVSSRNSNDYRAVSIEGKSYFVHRLVAETYLPNPNDYPIVNHIDCDKSNNCLGNLEWCSQQMNIQHALENDRFNKPQESKSVKWRMWTDKSFWGVSE